MILSDAILQWNYSVLENKFQGKQACGENESIIYISMVLTENILAYRFGKWKRMFR